MARWDQRLPENAPGRFYVDRTCIDCDICRQIAPSVYARSEGEQSFVFQQPENSEEQLRAAMALVACPTSSIGAVPKIDLAAAVRAFPEPIAEDVYFCGFTSERSYGASSYLIRRENGNVLVDSPRAAEPLLRRIQDLGGVRLMFLTHRDDVADHARFRERFGCERILHRRDVSGGARDVERQIEGAEPLRLDEELLVIPVPGHTAGSCCLLYRDAFLFTGDHLWWSDDPPPGLEASRSVCWWNWDEQKRSLARLLDFRFHWVLPGHGRRYRAPSADVMRQELERLVSGLR